MAALKFGSTKGDKIFRKSMFYKQVGDISGGDMITVEITLGGGHTKEMEAMTEAAIDEYLERAKKLIEKENAAQ